MRFVIIIYSLGLLACQSVRHHPKPEEIPGSYHTVQKGDTLDLIAKKYKCRLDDLKDINAIDEGQRLRLGQKLFIPDPDPISTTIAKVNSLMPQAQKGAALDAKENVSLDRIMLFPIFGGKVVRGFSKAKKQPYDGIGIDAPRGAKVLAALSGKVLFVGDEGTRYGLLVVIEHQAPYITVYTHLSKALVKVGQIVDQGSSIGLVGTSGGLKYPHLHFQVRVNQLPKDPRLFFKITEKPH
jgi:murein DD-endopeptidase MepM/ murein hydrolase activator NlpD